MNKQEAIKLLREMAQESFKLAEIHAIHVESVVDIISQIDEPQKPAVPQVAVDYYEEYKHKLSAFDEWFGDFFSNSFLEDFPRGDKLSEWLYDNNDETNRQRELALATLIVNGLDAVEVEQEPLYQIFMKNTTNHKNQIQQLVKQRKKWFFCGNDVHRFKTKFTKGQIVAAGFGWVFDCKGVEVKEVE